MELTESRERMVELERKVAMLSRLGGRGYRVKEEQAQYGPAMSDPESDFDPEIAHPARPPQRVRVEREPNGIGPWLDLCPV